MTSGWEMEWDHSGRKGRDGQKKKTGKANERRKKGKSKKEQKDEVNGQGGKKGGKGVPRPHAGHFLYTTVMTESQMYDMILSTMRLSEIHNV